MYDCSNSTTIGQVFDFIHYWKDGLMFGLNFVLPVAELIEQQQKHLDAAFIIFAILVSGIIISHHLQARFSKTRIILSLHTVKHKTPY